MSEVVFPYVKAIKAHGAGDITINDGSGLITGVSSAEIKDGTLTLECGGTGGGDLSIFNNGSSIVSSGSMSFSGSGVSMNNNTVRSGNISVRFAKEGPVITMPSTGTVQINNKRYNVAALERGDKNAEVPQTPAQPVPQYKLGMSTAAIKRISVSGGVSLRLRDRSVCGQELRVMATGTSAVVLPGGGEAFEHLTINTTGTASVTCGIPGKLSVAKLDVTSAGSSSIGGWLFVTEEAFIEAAGSSSVKVTAYSRKSVEQNVLSTAAHIMVDVAQKPASDTADDDSSRETKKRKK